MTKTEYLLRELRSRLWVKPSIMGVAAVLWVSCAYLFSDKLPEELLVDIKGETLISLLGIMASTMLTVATFSVAAMVAAFSTVSTTATPRATRIVMQDNSTQNSLTAFLSAFIYSIVALVAISVAPYYGISGRFLLFVGYSIMIIWVLVSFIRWVDRVSKLGRMGDTLARVEEACREAFRSRETMGTLGAKEAQGDPPDGARVKSDVIGYVQNIDVAALDEIGAELGSTIRILERPGAFVDPHDALASVGNRAELDEEIVERIRACFQLGDTRRVGSDPRFGLILLSEIADRALSPAVNDPGTAIAVLGIQVRLMEDWKCHISATNEVKYENVEVLALDPEDLLDDAFTAISRDGAAIFEVGSRIQKSLAVMSRFGNERLASAARRHSALALEQAMNSLPTEFHRNAIRTLSEKIGETNH
ncbi:MAG: DUF2254 domain-containing protein [Luteolibacter sp.]